MVYSIGIDAGSGVMGLLFHAIGSKTTLFCYSVTSAVIFVAFLAYIYFSKGLQAYEKLPENGDEEDENVNLTRTTLVEWQLEFIGQPSPKYCDLH